MEEQLQAIDYASQIYAKEYEHLEELGKGGFGVVFSCKHKSDGSAYAVKMIPFSEKHEKDTFKEIRAIFFIHPNSVRYYKAWVEDGVPDCAQGIAANNTEETFLNTSGPVSESIPPSDGSESSDSGEETVATKCLYLQMELCKCSLAEEMRNREFTGKEIMKIFGETLEGLSYIHSKNLIHADISTDNIFFDFQGVAKLGDFGLVIDDDGMRRGIGGKMKYLPPEVKNIKQGKKGKIKGKLSQACDIYALAVVLVELVFSLINTESELHRILDYLKKEKEFPKLIKLEDKAFELLAAMLSSDPSDRPSAKVIIARVHDM